MFRQKLNALLACVLLMSLAHFATLIYVGKGQEKWLLLGAIAVDLHVFYLMAPHFSYHSRRNGVALALIFIRSFQTPVYVSFELTLLSFMVSLALEIEFLLASVYNWWAEFTSERFVFLCELSIK